MADFEGTYQVEDGYIGNRPHHFTIYEGDVEEDMDELDLSNLFWRSIQDHFENNLYPSSRDEEAFMAWAKDVITARREEEDED